LKQKRKTLLLRLARGCAALAVTVAIAAAIIPVMLHEVRDYKTDKQDKLIEFITGRPVVGRIITPKYMHVGDSRIVEALPDRVGVGTKCDLAAPGFVTVPLPAEPGKCAWAIAPKDDGSKLVVAKVSDLQPVVGHESQIVAPVGGVRMRRHMYVGLGTVYVAQSPFSAAYIGVAASAVAVVSSVIGLYLQALGQKASNEKGGAKEPSVPKAQEDGATESSDAELGDPDGAT
jgi:hypothetical protein